MSNDTIITQEQAGCWMSNSRGHYISRDVIQLAQSFGFIIGSFEEFALGMYEQHNHEEEYPQEALIELCDEAVNWLNSGQEPCDNCEEGIHPHDGDYWTHKDDPTKTPRCKKCTGTGRGPRIDHQNFPPKVPEGFTWAFEDGDFGLWFYNEDGEFVIEGE